MASASTACQALKYVLIKKERKWKSHKKRRRKKSKSLCVEIYAVFLLFVVCGIYYDWSVSWNSCLYIFRWDLVNFWLTVLVSCLNRPLLYTYFMTKYPPLYICVVIYHWSVNIIIRRGVVFLSMVASVLPFVFFLLINDVFLFLFFKMWMVCVCVYVCVCGHFILWICNNCSVGTTMWSMIWSFCKVIIIINFTGHSSVHKCNK